MDNRKIPNPVRRISKKRQQEIAEREQKEAGERLKLEGIERLEGEGGDEIASVNNTKDTEEGRGVTEPVEVSDIAAPVGVDESSVPAAAINQSTTTAPAASLPAESVVPVDSPLLLFDEEVSAAAVLVLLSPMVAGCISVHLSVSTVFPSNYDLSFLKDKLSSCMPQSIGHLSFYEQAFDSTAG